MPRPFARKTKMEEKEFVFVKGKDKKGKWEVEIRHRNPRVDMIGGWPCFYKEYGLKEGDNCKFTQLKADVLLVEIVRKK